MTYVCMLIIVGIVRNSEVMHHVSFSLLLLIIWVKEGFSDVELDEKDGQYVTGLELSRRCPSGSNRVLQEGEDEDEVSR